MQIRGTNMDDNKKYMSFKIAFTVLLIVTVILIFNKKGRIDAFIAGFSTLAVGLIYSYFKIEDLIAIHHQKLIKARHEHLNK